MSGYLITSACHDVLVTICRLIIESHNVGLESSMLLLELRLRCGLCRVQGFLGTMNIVLDVLL